MVALQLINVRENNWEYHKTLIKYLKMIQLPNNKFVDHAHIISWRVYRVIPDVIM